MPLIQTKLDHKRKNKRKIIKVILQTIIVIVLAVIFIRAVFITSKYEALTSKSLPNTDGFVALSYFGVDRNGTAKYISKDELNKQLVHLKKNGFETISQQQIIDFYQNNTPLPENALFLSFEDGRNDSSIFSQSTLEKLNYQATMFTYADKMDTKDSKFLKPRHLKEMMKSGYWELGSNGYRLTYINIFNDQGEYLGEIPENDVPDKTMIEYYNHYLMDYVRDEYMIPKETRQELIERIGTDYDLMKTIYDEDFPSFPKAYAIMHANALYNNLHEHVDFINDQKIKEYFSIHFNRDRHAYNDHDRSLYNLNRLQVAPHWPVNHLLMKIVQDSNLEMSFVEGDASFAQQWIINNGVAEFDQDRIILTTEPNKKVAAILDQNLPTNFTATLRLEGNVRGNQMIAIRNSESVEQIEIELEKNTLSIYHNIENKIRERLTVIPLEEIKWSGEDYAFNKATKYSYSDTQQGSRIDDDEYPNTLNNDRQVEIGVNEGFLTVTVDHKDLIDIEVPFISDTYQLVLGGNFVHSNTSHEQDVDTIYDSIFKDLLIQDEEMTLYTNYLSKWDRFINTLTETGSDVVDFFIENF